MRFHHYAIEVNNLEESIAFYKKYLGFQTESRFFFMGEEIVFLASNDFRLELISGQGENDKTTHLCFEVSDLHEVMNRFDDIRKIEGPYKLQNGWETVFFEGPDQEIIEFLQVRPVS
ncbi:VOC family protein [Neobacillus sp.]|uniref:VOC family protein n=1 Tax=Neobacillus sp. TaxID=2675273 RepID=UPI00289CCC43|nr:VOC family protein [Neobacillus sp.]